MQCVILAGGLATRLRPLTSTLAKALIPAAGVPFIEHQLRWLGGHGVTEVVLCIGHGGERLRDHVGDGARFGLPVRYVDEGQDLRGTAGALRLALDRGALADSFLLTYGDSFLPVDFGAVWRSFREAGRPALMTVFENRGRWDTSNVIFDGQRVTLYDKHHRTRPPADFSYIDYGLSALDRRLVADQIPAQGKADLADLFLALSQRGDLGGFEVHERFYEIGSPAGLREFRDWMARRVLLVLDRDGVLNHTVDNPAEPRPDSPLHPDQAQVFAWVPETLRALTAAGFGMVVATNQPAWAKGKATRDALEATHQEILRQAQSAGGVILSSHVCFHRAEEGCGCRKPGTGLLAEAFARHPRYAPADAWMVGDRATDVLAGAAFGMRTALLAGAGSPAGSPDVAALAARAIRPSFCGIDLRDFARFLLETAHE
jgi:histidinol-phosphate phosphatase family protein